MSFTLQFCAFALLLSSATSYAVNRSTTEADHNWKFVFPRPALTAYVTATKPLPIDLNQLTVSFFVRDSKSNAHSGYFELGGTENRVDLRRYYGNLYFRVNGVQTYCTSCISQTDILQHIVVTWSATADANGVGSFWINGIKIHTFTGISASRTISKGNAMRLGQNYDSHGSYPFGGEIAYLNAYATYVTEAEEVDRLSKVATSDPEAVIPWGWFIAGAHGDVVLYPEYEIYSAAFTSIECRESNMTVTLQRSAFPHLMPARVGLSDHSCRASYTEQTVTITTGLAECGTNVSYVNALAKYSNYLVPDVVNPLASGGSANTPNAIINRGAVSLDATALKFHCSYPLIPHRTIPAYAVRSGNFEVSGLGERDFEFEVKLYHDASFKAAYQDHEYPLHMDSSEKVYAAAVLSTGGETRIGIWIERCVMTPDSDPDYSTNHLLIDEGCPVDDTVEYHASSLETEQHFSFHVFRFNSRPDAVVFMHCYIDICQADDDTSKCALGIEACAEEGVTGDA